MQMTRRQLCGTVAATALVFVAPPAMTVVRPCCDIDISAMALVYAMGVVGDGPYRLTVAPENVGYARMALSRAFGSDDTRYSDFQIVVKRLDNYIDSWALDNGRTMFYTVGA